MRNKRYAELLIRLVEHARYEVLPTPSAEETVLDARAAGPRDHRDRLAEQGPRGHPRPRGAAGRARLRRRAAPGRPHGARARRAGRDLRPADRQGHHPGLRARRGRRAGRRLPRRADACWRTWPTSGRPFAHVGITGYPESHPTITDDLTVQSMWDKRRYATHVVSNLTFDPAVDPGLGAADARPRGSRCRCCSACPARSSGPSCSRWRRRSASASPPGSWSSTRGRSRGWPPPAASPASGSWSSARPALAAPDAVVEGLHVFTFNQIAETEAWREDLLRAAAGLRAAGRERRR